MQFVNVKFTDIDFDYLYDYIFDSISEIEYRLKTLSPEECYLQIHSLENQLINLKSILRALDLSVRNLETMNNLKDYPPF